jgi:hypothetical protein
MSRLVVTKTSRHHEGRHRNHVRQSGDPRRRHHRVIERRCRILTKAKRCPFSVNRFGKHSRPKKPAFFFSWFAYFVQTVYNVQGSLIDRGGEPAVEIVFTEEQLAWCQKVSSGSSDYPYDRDDLLSEAMVALWKAATSGARNPDAWAKACFFNAKKEIWRRLKTLKRGCKPDSYPESGLDSLIDPMHIDPALLVEAADLYRGDPPIMAEPCLDCGTTGGGADRHYDVNVKPRRTLGLCNACYVKGHRKRTDYHRKAREQYRQAKEKRCRD